MTRLELRAGLAVLAFLGSWQLAVAQSVVVIDITKLSYSQPEVTIHLGDTVEWDNHDVMAHSSTASADQPGGAWEVLIPIGGSAKFKPSQVGSVSYFCRFHPNMKGRITVMP